MRQLSCILPILFALLAGCTREDWSIPATTCQLNFPDSSQQNPRNAEYQALLDKVVKQGVPGISLLVRTPAEGLWVGASGKSKIETGAPMMQCSIHHSASVAKMYMGTAVMLLVEEGRIDLDATIDNYLEKKIWSRIGNGNTATVRQLLNHSSGIRDFVEETNFIADYFNDYFNDFTTGDFLSYIYDKPALFRAGDHAEYCNTNAVLVTLIIEYVTGRPHADFLTERIFTPLGLTGTYYKNEPGYPRPPGLVNSYYDRFDNGQLENITEVAIRFDSLSVGHDAMLATPYDYAKFIDALLHGKIVSASSLKEMMRWKYDEKKETYNGLALLKRHTLYGDGIGHGGGNFGVAMIVQYYPDYDATIVLCTNISGFTPSPALEVTKDAIHQVEALVFD